MPMLRGKKVETEEALEILKLMMISARTAPKSKGVDDVHIAIVYGEEKRKIAQEMRRIAEEREMKEFTEDAEKVEEAAGLLLIGVKGTKSMGEINCGACGFMTCKEFNETLKIKGQYYRGPVCIFKTIDLGVAIGSAVKTADIYNLDSDAMYRVGATAMKLKILPDCDVIIGISVSTTGKKHFL